MVSYRDRARLLIDDIERTYKKLGQTLNEMEDGGLWDKINYTTWAAYCEGELGLPTRNRQAMQQVDRKYRVELGVDAQTFAGAHHSKLLLLAGVANEENVDLIVSDAARDSGKSMGDLRKLKAEGEYTGERKPIEPDPERVTCPTCGSSVEATKVQQ
jgi:hypothetical protein